MDLEAALAELTRALGSSEPGDRAGAGFRAARQILIDRGAEALSLPLVSGRSLDEVLALAAEAAPSPMLRRFAVRLVHALGVEGLLPIRGETERRTRSFLERALLNPLRRAGYPFEGSSYDKRRSLARLHTTIDEHLRPPEPSIPPWLHGARRPDDF